MSRRRGRWPQNGHGISPWNPERRLTTENTESTEKSHRENSLTSFFFSVCSVLSVVKFLFSSLSGLGPRDCKMKACLIVGDIVKSQKVEDLAGVLARLKKALNQINRKYKDELVGKFVIFGGDSFEGVLRTPRRAYDIYRHIFMALRPVRVRCVVGIGEIDSLAGGERPRDDGACLHPRHGVPRRDRQSSPQAEDLLPGDVRSSGVLRRSFSEGGPRRHDQHDRDAVGSHS